MLDMMLVEERRGDEVRSTLCSGIRNKNGTRCVFTKLQQLLFSRVCAWRPGVPNFVRHPVSYLVRGGPVHRGLCPTVCGSTVPGVLDPVNHSV